MISAAATPYAPTTNQPRRGGSLNHRQGFLTHGFIAAPADPRRAVSYRVFTAR
ncbi:hypothetical protein HMPREF0591_5205 [Mycobacterium parascrofulaceum ATCC BAA-614]|jgi:hypothetical protein|uniref:Uncharacterized protein n=1 Tax=Mycobacterium parascrofulaceum ATCC BAA-614 TaxID=525368 RepID=D5PGB1_9MYCO|nr:hypothetical protein HMPREF0591_5205 [Mycobacterium parascrofulaceum ATCC BAA-614]